MQLDLAEQAEVADRAADEIILRGGTEGSLLNSKGEVCLLGAIGMALKLNTEDSDVWDEYYIETRVATLFLGPLYDLCGGDPVGWNDSYCLASDDKPCGPVTDDDRIEVLRKAAKQLRKEIQK